MRHDGSKNELRPGEIAVTAPERVDAALVFIGRIATPWQRRSDCPRRGDPQNGPDCRLHLDPLWEPALDGVEAHAQLQLLYWMHEARRDLVRLAPRGHDDPAPRGTFALRAPTRPNPIASSVVALIGVVRGAESGPVLTVRGLDCLDGTPLLDIKPWRG